MRKTKPRKSKHKVRVKRSSAGLGLFTEDFIKKGDFVIEYFGPLLTDDEADEKGGKYLFDVEKGMTINGNVKKNLARYINHSCKPNCEPETDGTRVFIYAKRNIKPGEELTYHYGKEYWQDLIKPKGCKCLACKKKK